MLELSDVIKDSKKGTSQSNSKYLKGNSFIFLMVTKELWASVRQSTLFLPTTPGLMWILRWPTLALQVLIHFACRFLSFSRPQPKIWQLLVVLWPIRQEGGEGVMMQSCRGFLWMWAPTGVRASSDSKGLKSIIMLEIKMVILLGRHSSLLKKP